MIKYRVFDLNESKYVDHASIHVSISPDGKLTVGDTCSDTVRYVVQESLDIADSNGTTIYEGDILTSDIPLTANYQSVGNFIATIRNGSASFVVEYKVTEESKQETMDFTPRIFAKSCKIIGNVLQHA